MKYVLDTTAWYAWTISTDRFHQRTSPLLETNPELVVPFAVFEELAALIYHLFGKVKAIEALQPLLDSDQATIIRPNEADSSAIWQLFTQLAPKIDYVDASVYYYARKLKLPIFTFDSHFQDLRPRPHLVP